MKNSVTLTKEQIQKKTGVQYRVSGNLFIATTRCKTPPSGYSGNRGDIVGFSHGSGVRMRRYLRECVSDYSSMVTLTYPYCYPTNGTETKEHLRRFLQELRREDARRPDKKESDPPYSAFWFLEFQERGAPHYHIFTNRPVDKKWCSRRWYDIVNSEDIRHLHAGTRCEQLKRGRAGTISYASKYAAKQEQKSIPVGFNDVGRFWGVSGHRVTMAADTFVSRADSMNSQVITSQKHITNELKRLISISRAQVYMRKENVLIVIINEKFDQMRLRRMVGALGALTQSHYNMFEGAEISE